jgi:hypothetical protein
MENYNSLITKMKTDTVYFINEFEGIVFKSSPGDNGGFYARTKGGQEFTADYTTTSFNDALADAKIISESDYLNY